MEKCKICGREFKNIVALLIHVSENHKIKSKEYYDTYFKKENEGICPVCGKETNYKSFSTGYTKYCPCCTFKSDEVKDKIKKTNLNRLGVEWPTQSKDIQEKIKKVSLERYGVDNPAKSQEVKDKVKKTNLEKYGKEYYSQTDEYREHSVNTCIKKFGVENAAQSEDIKKQIRKTNLERYGKEYYSQTDEYREKVKQTSLERYNTEHFLQSDVVKEKIMNTMLDRYDINYIFQREDIQEMSHSQESLEKSYNTKKKNNTFSSSKPEKELEIELRKLFPDLKTQYKSEVYPFACDYYVPSLDLYIEYNGMWTHGGCFYDENNEDNRNTLEMWKQCSEHSIFYKNAIDGWTHRDILKLNTALKNNLNYIAWFNEEQAYDWIERMTHEKEKTEKTC